MHLIAPVKLQASPEQNALLSRTLHAANAACTYVSQVAWETQTFRRFPLQRRCYTDIRKRFNLGAQMAVRVIAKVADAYRRHRCSPQTFRPRGSVAFDRRNLSWNLDAGTVSLWTVGKRQRIPFVCGKRQTELLATQQGESDLVYQDGTFYLYASCAVPSPTPEPITDYLGVDMGLRNIAVTSDGQHIGGGHVLGLRHRHRRLRQRLQKTHTKAAKRLLRQRRRKERRFMADVNHCVAKQLVTSAQDTHRGIALENLTGIRWRVSVRRRQRVTLHSWAFGQLRQFIEYKAQRAGVAVIFVDPRNTSRTCLACGHIDKKNRKSPSNFQCVRCGFAGPADLCAAENIRRAAVHQPHVSPDDVKATYRLRTVRRTATEGRDKPSPSGKGR